MKVSFFRQQSTGKKTTHACAQKLGNNSQQETRYSCHGCGRDPAMIRTGTVLKTSRFYLRFYEDCRRGELRLRECCLCLEQTLEPAVISDDTTDD